MAGKITHLEVLSQICKHLDHGTADQRKIALLMRAESNRKFANIGAIAPDIFYFYHVFSPRKTKKATMWGDMSHHNSVTELVLSFLDLILQTEVGIHRDRYIAFTLGYICHCVVDIVTHPYIFYISGDFYNKDKKISSLAQYNHMRVENALDSWLLDYRWGMTPKEYDFVHHVDAIFKSEKKTWKMDPMLWHFWLRGLKATFLDEFKKYYIGSENKIIPGDLLNESFLGYLEFHKVLDSRSGWIRGTLKFLDRITFHKVRSSVLMLPLKEHIDKRIMNEEKKKWNYPADPSIVRNDSFVELINRSAQNGRDALTHAWNYLENKMSRSAFLKEYQGYNLDTGLRFQGVDSMKEFSPLEEV
ncbi:zinc dependent phospholipase C family protein [Leptospira borgpetersenii]|uniref:zinc dependent phospholipase C family protein n=1 Tax=Leptospira borgpetersenii TaxID=174 RepID=UPI0007738361|nr:zinc dependent phospholipase C family protein [Leptospira borgpetersenii]MBF3377826.1 zinc dependent phospholipase C family protein [Leptospira borgpetersenii serovar Balcanica]